MNVAKPKELGVENDEKEGAPYYNKLKIRHSASDNSLPILGLGFVRAVQGWTGVQQDHALLVLRVDTSRMGWIRLEAEALIHPITSLRRQTGPRSLISYAI